MNSYLDIAKKVTLGNTQGSSRADVEFARFARVAKPMPGGGLYDPINGAPEMPSGVPIEDWRAFENDCAHLGKAVRP